MRIIFIPRNLDLEIYFMFYRLTDNNPLPILLCFQTVKENISIYYHRVLAVPPPSHLVLLVPLPLTPFTP